MALLGELVDITGGGTPGRKIAEYWNGEIPWATVKDFKSVELKAALESITEEGLNKSASNLIPAGSIIVPTRMAVGKAAINTVEMAINQDLKALIIKDKKKVDRDYLFRSILSKSSYLERRGKGATVKGITLDVLREMELPLPPPPLKEQKRIAAILDKADAIRRKSQQAIDLTDQLLRSVFLDMFGDPVTTPKDWDVTVFGDLIDVLTDYHANGSYKILKKHVALKNTKNYALMVRTTDLESENFTDNVKWINESAYTFLKKTKVYGGELLVNKIGSAGAVYLMPHLDTPVSLAMNQFMIRCNEKCNNIFAYHYLKTEHADRKIKERVQGAVTKTITKDAMRSIQFINPPIDLQNKFVGVVAKIENDLADKLNNNKLDDLFNSLAQQAFNGALSKQTKAA
ncbi:Type I restriction-modification system, specificity subunit S [hydrothermal vent metagenome]|uniref:Type I restriction-modification system, specificity subunit S n=1 Tax=hydrothermal vent metagenome TaxID=652676 RepID=A0A3B0W970_9ZZZZ